LPIPPRRSPGINANLDGTDDTDEDTTAPLASLMRCFLWLCTVVLTSTFA
jgi:hypothetical protein